MTRSRIVAIGGELFTTAFMLQGIDGFVTSEAECKKMVEFVMKDKSVGVIFLEHGLYEANQPFIDAIKAHTMQPIFVEIPMDESTRVHAIGDMMKKCTGITFD